jgi:undecaprenyl pyrophosphate phosphatase UppP
MRLTFSSLPLAVVALHLETALALLVYFWPDGWALLASLGPDGRDAASRERRRLLGRMVLGTIPACSVCCSRSGWPRSSARSRWWRSPSS